MSVSTISFLLYSAPHWRPQSTQCFPRPLSFIYPFLQFTHPLLHFTLTPSLKTTKTSAIHSVVHYPVIQFTHSYSDTRPTQFPPIRVHVSSFAFGCSVAAKDKEKQTGQKNKQTGNNKVNTKGETKKDQDKQIWSQWRNKNKRQTWSI